MLISSLKTLFRRDLERLKTEIELYKNEDKIWVADKNITNPAGNLCLHLVGNLNTYIGATLGQSGYIRNRELEFSLKDIPRAELITKIEQTIDVIEQTLNVLPPEQLDAEYPLIVLQNKTTTGFFLMHLATHLAYHLGQVNYHRRLLDV